MVEEVSREVRTVLWKLMTDEEFRREAQSEGLVSAANAHGIQLDDKEAKKIGEVDQEDLGDLLGVIERDLSLMMGGSRPRRAIALSDSAIAELQAALKAAQGD